MHYITEKNANQTFMFQKMNNDDNLFAVLGQKLTAFTTALPNAADNSPCCMCVLWIDLFSFSICYQFQDIEDTFIIMIVLVGSE